MTGKRVVITGASRGLGRLLACEFSRDGARVALVARTEADLKAVADELPGPSLVLPGEVTDAEFNEAVADATMAEWGGVDVWICNAGISPIVAGPVETDPAVKRQVTAELAAVTDGASGRRYSSSARSVSTRR